MGRSDFMKLRDGLDALAHAGLEPEVETGRVNGKAFIEFIFEGRACLPIGPSERLARDGWSSHWDDHYEETTWRFVFKKEG